MSSLLNHKSKCMHNIHIFLYLYILALQAAQLYLHMMVILFILIIVMTASFINSNLVLLECFRKMYEENLDFSRSVLNLCKAEVWLLSRVLFCF